MGITKSSLFYGIDEENQKQMMHCFNSYIKNFLSEEIICYFDDEDMGIGIIEKGNAKVIHNSDNGTQTILEYLEEGDIFGQLFYYYVDKENITLEASSDCTIRFIDYEHIVKRCPKACSHHSQLVNNVLMMVSEKTQSICEHLEVLSRRTIREKLISYFDILATQNESKTFILPFTLSVLSDYLSVDRSAMSRELRKMKEEGLISMNKKEVTIKY